MIGYVLDFSLRGLCLMVVTDAGAYWKGSSCLCGSETYLACLKME